MEIRQLRYFQTLARQQHMAITAEALGVSQSTLSKSLAALEADLGVKLFDRKGNRIYLNQNGEDFARSVDKILSSLEASKLALHQNRFEFNGQVRITCRAFADNIMDCVSEYMRLNPRVQVNVFQSPQGETNLAGNIDFLLTGIGSSPLVSEWNYTPLLKDDAEIMISPRYREYPDDVTELSPADLRDDLFIADFIFTDLFHYQDLVRRVCQTAGFLPKIVFSTDDFLSKAHLLEDGRAITILPHSCYRILQKIAPSVRAFKIPGTDTTRTIGLMYRKDQQLSEEAKDFLDFAVDFFR